MRPVFEPESGGVRIRIWLPVFINRVTEIGDLAELHHTDYKYDSQFVIRAFPDYEPIILQV